MKFINDNRSIRKHFSEYNYDIVNINSETGDKVREAMENKYGTINEYPRVNYFENGKLIESWDASTEYDLTYFKDLIENNN